MAHRPNRRKFMQTTAAASAGFWVAGNLQADPSNAANEQINFASIGVGGKGASDAAGAAKHGKMVGICDVDTQKLRGAANRYKEAEQFQDYREMLDKLGDQVDAVTVSTPDHTHAPASIMAMNMGKHCFCQKPLTHTIAEARKMGDIAREKKLATMMGNQGTAHDGLREAAAIIRAGGLGKVTDVHVWTNRPVWPQGGARPNAVEPPGSLDWDLWLGSAPKRPYGPGYHTFSWRGWWDFGTGALGDMACHTLNMAFMGLNLRDPLSVKAETSGHNKDSYPKWSLIDFEFGAMGDRAPLTLHWYDGGKRPPLEMFHGKNPSRSGCLIVGEKGKLYTPDDYGAKWEILTEGLQAPKVEYNKSPGHVQEWVNAIRGGEPATSNFPDYAGPLTETILLGNLAVWDTGNKVEWDAKKMEAKGRPDLMKLVNKDYREGFGI